MRYTPQIFLAVFLGLFGLGSVRAQTAVEQAVVDFQSLTRNYNLITLGNATLTNTHTDGAVAVMGNLTLRNGTDLVLHGQTLNSSDPAVYVNGQISLQNDSKLLNGYIYAPNLNSSTNWNSNPGQRWLESSSGKMWVNSNHAYASTNPRNTPAPTGWDLASTTSQLAAVSSTLGAAASTGTINFSNNSIQLNTSLTSGVVIFNVDASQLASISNTNIQINVPSDMVYVINVHNAAGQTLFGGGGNNGNAGQNNDQLLWNILPDSDPNTSNSVNLGANFYGSILAPLVDINSDGRYVNGQVVANNYTQNSAEIHYVKFDAPIVFTPVPEPQTWGLFGVAGCAFLMFWRRRARRDSARA